MDKFQETSLQLVEELYEEHCLGDSPFAIHTEKMRHLGTWGTRVELQAASDISLYPYYLYPSQAQQTASTHGTVWLCQTTWVRLLMARI